MLNGEAACLTDGAPISGSRYMTKKDMVINEVKQLPDALVDEVLDFVRFLSNKCANESRETALASEFALQKDWLKPEEDAAWQHL